MHISRRRAIHIAALATQEYGARDIHKDYQSSLDKFGNNWPDARYPDSQDTVETLAVLNEADAHFSSWTFWESKIVWNLTSSGSLNTNLAKVLARPYPQAIAGTPTKVHLVCPNG